MRRAADARLALPLVEVFAVELCPSLDRVEREDAAYSDDMEGEDDDQSVRELHVRLLFGVVVFAVQVLDALAAAFARSASEQGAAAAVSAEEAFSRFFSFS